MKKMKLLALVLCAFLMFAQGCGNTSSGKPIVSVSIVPQAEWVKAVAGDDWEVNVIIPAGSSPENYEPTMADRMALEDSAVFFAMGVPAEAASILPLINGEKVLDLSAAAAQEYPELTMAGGRDPHTWLSPKRVVAMVGAIAEWFAEYDPENKAVYLANAEKYIEDLNAADKYIADKIAHCPKKEVIAFHPAFCYFGDDYGIKMHALQHDGREATLQHMQDLSDYAEENGIKAIVYQSEIDSKQAEAFAQQIGGKTVMLKPLAADYIENIKETADILAEIMK